MIGSRQHRKVSRSYFWFAKIKCNFVCIGRPNNPLGGVITSPQRVNSIYPLGDTDISRIRFSNFK
ncbi:hypothetical protein SAMN05720354_11147 [Nitrosospira sp. Nsp1]|nr:hypothetical protein SAMN05720354_11147 [Nitrosospira sp. Nsp1]